MTVSKKIRESRTLSLSNVPLSIDEKAQLATLYNDPRYDTLLDVFERGCILQDTKLVNTPAHEEVAVLAEHKLSKAFWELLVWVQAVVLQAHRDITNEPEPERAPVSDEEFFQGVE
jgi:hypothetical protein